MQAFRFNGGERAPRIDLLPPEPQARPKASSVPRRADVVDVDFETVPVYARRNVYPVFNDNRNGRAANFTAPRKPSPVFAEAALKGLIGFERLLQAASLRVFACVVACLCLVTFLSLSGLSPADAPSTLAISGVTARLDDANGMRVVSVYGTVENNTDAVAEVPVIQIDIDADGHTRTASRILSGESLLLPGETRPFAARLPHAGGKLPQIKVSFAATGASVR